MCHLKREDTHFFIDMEFASSVKVEDGVEWSRMSIKEVLVISEAVVSGQLQDPGVGLHTAQAAQARVTILQYTNTII